MNPVKGLLSIFLVAVLITSSKQDKKSGPFDIFVQQVELCEDQGTNALQLDVKMYLKQKYGTKVRVHKGGLTIPYIGNEMENLTLEGDFYMVKDKNELFMYKYDGEYCDAMTNIVVGFYRDFRKMIGIDQNGCVIPKGTYSFGDWEVPFDLPTPMLEYGLYKFVIRVLYNAELVGCVKMEADVKEKAPASPSSPNGP